MKSRCLRVSLYLCLAALVIPVSSCKKAAEPGPRATPAPAAGQPAAKPAAPSRPELPPLFRDIERDLPVFW